MKKKNIIILHDTFLYKWGWERLIMMMGKILSSDIASGFFSQGSFDLRSEWFTGKMIPVSSEIFAKWFRHIKLKFAFLYKTQFITQYDTVIFSGDCISAVRNTSDTQKKIYYCHTPPRYLYDLKDQYLAKVPFLLKPIFLIISVLFRYMYERDIQKMDIIVTNSQNTQTRIKDFLWLNAHILYPPVDLDEFSWMGQWDYYLSCARLSWAKRVDMIVQAFQNMPDKKLKVMYGLNDPDREKIFSLAEWYKNIECITLPGNIGFKEMVAHALATIYIPIDEDFGMIPVESMSAGKPVIGVNEWGLKESIIHGETGILLKPDFTLDDICDAVNGMTPELALSMREACEKRAHDFGIQEFGIQLKEYIKK